MVWRKSNYVGGSKAWAARKPYAKRRWGISKGRTANAVTTPNLAVTNRGSKQMNYPTVTLTRGPRLWPDKMVVKLTYNDYDTINLLGNAMAANTGNQFYYRANDCFYPLGGVTPANIPGRGEMAEMYGKCRVLASSIRVTVQSPNTGTADAYPVFVALGPQNISGLGAGPSFGPNVGSSNGIKQSGGATYVKSRTLNPDSDVQLKTLYNYITITKAVGHSEVLTSDNYSAFTGLGVGTPTSPAQLVDWYLAACRFDEQATTEVTLYTAQITYWVEFYSRDIELS